MKRVPELDGIRGIAITLVLTHHLQGLLFLGLSVTPVSKVASRIFDVGWIGVDIFFVLSGFLITGILLREQNSPSFWRVFYVRRALRILPAFLVVFLIVLSILPPVSWRVLLTYLFFLGNWTIVNGTEIAPLSHIWSLAVEEQFYLVWPLVARRISRYALLYTSISVALFSIALRVILAAMHVDAYVIYKITPTRLDGLAIGAALAVAMGLARPRLFLKRNYKRFLLSGIAIWIAGFCALKFSYFFGNPRSTVLAIPAVEIMTSMAIFASLESLLTAKGQRILINPVLRWCGTRSYGLYLIHEPLHQVAQYFSVHFIFLGGGLRFGANIALTASVLAISVLLTELSWRIIERPALRLSASLTAKMKANRPNSLPVGT